MCRASIYGYCYIAGHFFPTVCTLIGYFEVTQHLTMLVCSFSLLSLFFSRLFLHYFSHLFFLVFALTRSAFSIFILFNDYFLCSKQIVRT